MSTSVTPALALLELEKKASDLRKESPTIDHDLIKEVRKSISDTVCLALKACEVNLPSSASLEECEQAVRKLHEAADSVRAKVQAQIDELRKTFDADLASLNAEIAVLKDMSVMLSEIDQIDESNKQDLQQLHLYRRFSHPPTVDDLENGHENHLHRRESARGELVAIYNDFDPHEDISFKVIERVTQLLQHQSLEVQQTLLQDTPAHRAMDSLSSTRPPCPEMGPKRPFTSTDKEVPLEVADMIFNYCDLESLLELRQVNSFWYKTFRQLDKSVRKKVLDRNPWMEPGDSGTDMETWGDCALVFVGRLKSSQWREIWSVDQVNLSAPDKRPSTVILASDLKGKLPCGFQAVEETTSLKLTGSLMLDMCTLQTSAIEDDDYDRKYTFESDKITIDFEDKSLPQVVIPGYEFFGLSETEVRERFRVSLGDQHIVVAINDYGANKQVYVMPRDFPDFRQGRGLKYGVSGPFRLNCIMLPSAYTAQKFDDKCPSVQGTLLIADMFKRRMVTMFSSHLRTRPITAYDGLLWLQVHDRRSNTNSLVPVLFDLKDEAVDSRGGVCITNIFCRQSRIINGIKGYREKATSSTRRYVVIHGKDQMEVADLATGNVALVRGKGHVFAGFNNGKFEAWTYSGATLDRYRQCLKRRKKEHHDQIRYDLWSRNRNKTTFDLSGAWEEKGQKSEEEEAWGHDRWGKWGRLS